MHSEKPGRGLVGREAELTRLRSALAAATEGHGHTILIGGEPGIGKTALAEAFAAEAEGQGAAVYRGYCHGGDGMPPYWPWQRLLQRALRQAAIEPDRLPPPVAWLLPELAPAGFPDHSVLHLESRADRAELLSSVSDLLGELAAHRPIVLLIDDVHQADIASLLLFDFIARESWDKRLLVIATYRDTELNLEGPLREFLAQAPALSHAMLLTLRGLAPEAIAALAGRWAPVAPANLAALARDTAGNPLYIIELERLRQQQGARGEINRASELPASIRDMIGRRLERISPNCRDMLTIAAVCGQEFDLDVVTEAAGRIDVVAAVLEAERQWLLQSSSSAGHYQFAHGLVRETLLAAIAADHRAALHERVAETIEARWGDHPNHLAELAGHYLRARTAETGERAARYCRLAGNAAMNLLAFEDAAAWFAAALDAQPAHTHDDDLTQLELLLSVAEAQNRAGEAEQARETYRRAARQATRLESPQHLARAALGLGEQTINGGIVESRDHLAAHLEAALRMLPEQETAVRVQVMARLARALHFGPESARAARLSLEAVAAARALDDPRTLTLALNARRRIVSGPDALAERVALSDEIERLTRATADIDREMDAAQWRVTDLLEAGDTPAVDARLATYAARAEAQRQPYYRWWSAIWRAMRALESGTTARAEELVEAAQATRGPARDPDALLVFKHQLFALRRQQGRLAEIAGLIEADAATYTSLPRYRARLALLYAETGQLDSARRLFDDLAGDPAGSGFVALPRDGLWLSALAYLADVCAVLNDRERAAPLYHLMLPFAGRFVVVATGVVRDGAVDRSLGVLAATRGEWLTAEAHFADAVAHNDRAGAHWWAAWSRFAWGTMLSERVHPPALERGQPLIASARSAAVELGLSRLAQASSMALSEHTPLHDRATNDLTPAGPSLQSGGAAGDALARRIAALEDELARARLAAYQDALTKLANRTGWDNHLDMVFAGDQEDTDLALLMLDLDNLKEINDTFGHEAGDRALREVAAQCRAHLGQDAFIARYGGDEFAALFQGAGARTAAERCAALLAALGRTAGPAPATLSAGLTRSVAGDTPATLFRRADAALYAAKRSGRNRLVVHSG